MEEIELCGWLTAPSGLLCVRGFNLFDYRFQAKLWVERILTGDCNFENVQGVHVILIEECTCQSKTKWEHRNHVIVTRCAADTHHFFIYKQLSLSKTSRTLKITRREVHDINIMFSTRKWRARKCRWTGQLVILFLNRLDELDRTHNDLTNVFSVTFSSVLEGNATFCFDHINFLPIFITFNAFKQLKNKKCIKNDQMIIFNGGKLRNEVKWRRENLSVLSSTAGDQLTVALHDHSYYIFASDEKMESSSKRIFGKCSLKHSDTNACAQHIVEK